MPAALPPDASVCLVCQHAELLDRARSIARDLKLPLVTDPSALPAGSWQLFVDEGGLSMRQTGPRAPGPVAVDFVTGKMGFRRQHQEATPALVKAVGVRSGIHPVVWDVTAGLGQDGFVLARYGCRVQLFERNPLVYALLADGLARAREFAARGDDNLREIVDRIRLVPGDGIEILSESRFVDSPTAPLPAPEVIYIDTMFPERSKSAKVKKGMQLFQDVVGEDPDADQLFELALERAHNRVVVKRPRHAPPLGQAVPSLNLSGKSIRFDVYPLKKLGSL
jgi:16S rRNA (guanine1516-N2)-methyltransferase